MKFAALLLAAPLAWADPREKPADYPVHADLRAYMIGAEYSGRTFFSDGKAYDSGDFISVEVGIFPRKGTSPKILISQFALEFNGKKELVFAQTPGAVAVAMRMQPWDVQRRRVIAGAGPLIVGAPPPTERFPGDPGARNRLPNPPRAPGPDHEQNVEREAPVDYGDLVNREGLLEGPIDKPVRGYLFFPYEGKLTKLKKIKLVIVDENNRGSLAIK